jgi:hypothetical protein
MNIFHILLHSVITHGVYINMNINVTIENAELQPNYYTKLQYELVH